MVTRELPPKPEQSLIGGVYKHIGNNKIYVIVDFIYFGDTDEWLIAHMTTDDADTVFVRTVDNFFGSKACGSPRFEKLV